MPPAAVRSTISRISTACIQEEYRLWRSFSTKRRCKIKQGFGSLAGRTISHTSDLIPTEPDHNRERPSGDQIWPDGPSGRYNPLPTNAFAGLCMYSCTSTLPPSTFFSSAAPPSPPSRFGFSFIPDLSSKKAFIDLSAHE